MAVQSGRRPLAQSARDAESARQVGATGASPAFVGRDETLTTVVDVLEQGPSLVLIEGEPGIGKTRLLRETLATPSLAERTVLIAACPPLREPFPLGPVVDGLRRLRQQASDIELSALGLSPLGGALRPLFPEWADDLPPALEPLDDPRETRQRVLAALTELVDRLEVGLLVVEDAHWADSATLEWLLTLTTNADLGMSIVTTFRPTDVHEDSRLLRLTSRPTAAMGQLRVELEPLDVEQTRQLVASMFGTEEVSEKFAAFLHEHTDGVPLAVEESVRLLRDRHDIVRHDGQWERRLLDELEVPPTVRDSVLERVTRLAPETRRVLEAAAVLAAPADEALLTAVAGLDEEDGEKGVAVALASGLLREVSPGRFVFRHALDAQAVAEATPASQWRRLHGRAADALRTVDPAPVVRLARHFREAGDTEAWCRYGEASADLALEAGDNRTAVLTLLKMFTSVGHPLDRRVRLAHKLGEAAYFGKTSLADLADRVVGVLRGVLDCGALGQGSRGELRLLLGRMLWTSGHEVDAFEEYEAAVPDLGHRPDLAIRAMTNLALPVIPDWPATRHLHWLDRASNLVDKNGSRHDRIAFNAVRATTLLLLGDEAGWESIDITEATNAKSPEEEWRAAAHQLNIASATLQWGRYTDTRRVLDAAVEYIGESDNQRFTSQARVAAAYLDWYTGAWQTLGDSVSEQAHALETEPVLKLQARQMLGLVDLVSGARERAERTLRTVAEECNKVGVAEPLALLAPAALARLRLADSASEDAFRTTEPWMAIVARKGVWLWAGDIAPVHVDALIAAERLGQAEDLVAQFAEGLAGRDAPAPAAALQLCRAILAEASGEPAKAADLFAEAAAAWSALPRPYDESLALERQGACLLAVGERDEALQLLSDVQQRLSDLGAKWDADRLAHLLRQHGVEVSRAWKRGPRGYGGELSPRELEVLALVARGMTNRQVGEVLFLSPKTVGVHLSAAMRKLGVSSRTAAAMAATEAGLISADDVPPS